MQNVKDYEGILAATKGSTKAKQLAAQLIPRFFKYFPDLSNSAVDAHLDLCEDEDLGVSHLSIFSAMFSPLLKILWFEGIVFRQIN